MRAGSLLGFVPLCAAAAAWLCPAHADPIVPSAPMTPVAALPATPALHRLTNSEAGAGRRWVRAVRDLAADRFDVDALPPRTPVDVWTVDDEVVAFAVLRAPDDGGTFRAIRKLVDGAPTWLSDTGATLTSPLSTRPTPYRAISSNIGMREHPVRKKMKFHAGTDFAASIGTPVYAIADGTVVKATRSWTAGKYLVIKHDTGHETRLMHLDRKVVGIEEGVRVKKGQLVGLVGKTGRVTGPHLHFELRDARGTPLDAARVRWPADGAVTDARTRAQIAHRFAVLASLQTRVPLELIDPTRAPAPTTAPHHPRPAPPWHDAPPVVPVRSDVARARMTPPLPRKRRALPPGASLYDDLDEAQLDDPLVRRALLLAAEFSWPRCVAAQDQDRREFKRVRAPVYCRPVGLSLRFLTERGKPTDISRGGMRIYADDAPKKGTQLEIELFLPDNGSVTCRVEVVWIEELAAGAPARFDVGLRFVEIKDEDRARLGGVLDDG